MDDASGEEVAAWHLRRALETHRRTGRVLGTKEACEAGLIRLMEDARGGRSTNGGEGATAAKKLVYLHAASSLLCRILADRISWIATAGAASPEEWNDDPRLMVSALRFCSMEPSETVLLVLGRSGCGKGGDAMAFRKHVGGFVDEGMGCLVPTHDGTRYDGAVPARYSGSAG